MSGFGGKVTKGERSVKGNFQFSVKWNREDALKEIMEKEQSEVEQKRKERS